MATLEKVKEYLNIDFPDNDAYLGSLISAAEHRALSISGLEADILIAPEIENAIIEDVAAMYQGRGEDGSGSQRSIATYRRYSTRPMF